MYRAATWVVGLLAIAAATPAAQQPSSASEAARPVLATHRLLQDSLDRLSRGSALWRHGLEDVRQSGRWALVLTPDDLARIHPGRVDTPEPGVLAEVVPITRGGTAVHAVLVVVNVPLIERMHERRGSLPGELHADLDRILAHEVYGHAVPYLLAGDLSGRCPDPAPFERASDACAIQRENAVRAELGLGRRTDAGVGGLLIAWLGRP
jgi:hypothetical protein